MLAIKTLFDGKKIVLPRKLRGTPPGKVVVIFEELPDEDDLWHKAQESAFAKAWDNAKDAAYDDF